MVLDFFRDLGQWFVDFWWAIILTTTFVTFLISYFFNHIIKSEMDRGGEEYGERATTRIQKWTIAFLVGSAVLTFGVIVFKILIFFELIHFGR